MDGFLIIPLLICSTIIWSCIYHLLGIFKVKLTRLLVLTAFIIGGGFYGYDLMRPFEALHPQMYPFNGDTSRIDIVFLPPYNGIYSLGLGFGPEAWALLKRDCLLFGKNYGFIAYKDTCNQQIINSKFILTLNDKTYHIEKKLNPSEVFLLKEASEDSPYVVYLTKFRTLQDTPVTIKVNTKLSASDIKERALYLYVKNRASKERQVFTNHARSGLLEIKFTPKNSSEYETYLGINSDKFQNIINSCEKDNQGTRVNCLKKLGLLPTGISVNEHTITSTQMNTPSIEEMNLPTYDRYQDKEKMIRLQSFYAKAKQRIHIQLSSDSAAVRLVKEGAKLIIIASEDFAEERYIRWVLYWIIVSPLLFIFACSEYRRFRA